MNEVKSFILEKRDEFDDFFDTEDVESICEAVRETFGVQCMCSHVGGFDSPGYAVDCYAVSYIGTDGVLGMVDFESENY